MRTCSRRCASTGLDLAFDYRVVGRAQQLRAYVAVAGEAHFLLRDLGVRLQRLDGWVPHIQKLRVAAVRAMALGACHVVFLVTT